FFDRVAVAAILFARLLLLDEVDDRLGVGERVGRGAKDRLRHRVAELLPLLAGMDGHRREVTGAHLRLVSHRDSQRVRQSNRNAWGAARATKKTAACQVAVAARSVRSYACSTRKRNQLRRGGRSTRWLFSSVGCKRPQIPSAIHPTSPDFRKQVPARAFSHR